MVLRMSLALFSYCRTRELVITLQILWKHYEKVEHHTSKFEKPARNIGGEAANTSCPSFEFGRMVLDFLIKLPKVCAVLPLIPTRDNTIFDNVSLFAKLSRTLILGSG